MKNIAHILLSLFAVVLLMVSCTGNKREFNIGVSQCSMDQWRQQMNGEIRRQTVLYDDSCKINLDFRSADDNNEKQIADIRRFIDNKVDLIIVAPNEAAALTPIVEEAFLKGIPVVVVDRKILSDKYTAFVGADNYDIGDAVGKYISAQFTKPINVVEFRGLSSSTPAQGRHDGFTESISENPNINVVTSVDALWTVKEAYNKMDSILNIHKNIDLVFAHNDPMAMGAYVAAKARHRENEIKFIGIDALAGDSLGMGLVKQGKLMASFVYPTDGGVVLDIAMRILLNKPFSRNVALETAVVDAKSVEGLILQTRQIAAQEGNIEKLHMRISDYTTRYNTQTVVLYASLIILVLVVAMLAFAAKTLSMKNSLNAQLREQRDELESKNEQLVQLSRELEEATQAKLVFFTNISHDFRTPLTLISDPVDQLLKSESLTDRQRSLLEIVNKNTNILLRLVNQILDFRKYENGKMDFSPQPIDILGSFKTWSDSFKGSLVKRHIHYDIIANDAECFTTLADKAKLESIFFNLMSNALKYTPENGVITLRVYRETLNEMPFITFSMANSGSLISPEHINQIFDRFYKTDLHHSGSGIGLALVKAFVEMHGGKIAVDSGVKQGTVFTVNLPFVECMPQESDVCQSSEIATEIVDVCDDPEECDAGLDTSKPVVLIIDDNQDIRSYVGNVLSDTYTVLEAANGSEGIRRAMKYVPDIIICDVMMPGMDGLECCRRLKSEIQTCHIPVLMLTACALDRQRIDGYSCGADSYIAKPFSTELLRSRIANLIDNRKALFRYFSESGISIPEKPGKKDAVIDADKNFVEDFRRIVEENIANSELNVQDIASQMGFSRVQLFRKIKALTNYSPNEFVRNIRLKKAHSLLASQDLTVAEVCYAVGFSSPSYFTKCYKAYFGEIPTAVQSRADE